MQKTNCAISFQSCSNREEPHAIFCRSQYHIHLAPMRKLDWRLIHDMLRPQFGKLVRDNIAKIVYDRLYFAERLYPYIRILFCLDTART